MKIQKRGALAHVASVITMALMIGAVFSGQAAAAGISDSKHNLGSGGPGNKFTTAGAGSGEICVFCHTPHGSDTAAKIPLWNRSASTGVTYVTYNSLGTLSLDGGTAAVGSTSIACLSCHDGAQAMNNVINAPGSGLVGDAAWQAGITTGAGWSGPRQTNGKMTGLAAVANDAESLKNDHPIGIQYAGGPKIAANIPRTLVAGAIPDYEKTNFKDPDFQPAKSAILGGSQVWWVETNADGVRQKTDLPLYARTGTVTFTDGTTSNVATAEPFVECASCHDPHSEKATFLRTDNSASKVCLSCHDK
jgi:predicted CXXCH cytochrome family protein